MSNFVTQSKVLESQSRGLKMKTNVLQENPQWGRLVGVVAHRSSPALPPSAPIGDFSAKCLFTFLSLYFAPQELCSINNKTGLIFMIICTCYTMYSDRNLKSTFFKVHHGFSYIEIP